MADFGNLLLEILPHTAIVCNQECHKTSLQVVHYLFLQYILHVRGLLMLYHIYTDLVQFGWLERFIVGHVYTEKG